MNYSDIQPLESAIPANRQGAKRHYGVHPYFTRRPYNVVRKYILHYSKEGDRVLDPFGGSGVTAIEAFLENRVGIHNDINPLANFIAQGIADLYKGDINDYHGALRYLEERCKGALNRINESGDIELDEIQAKLSLPANVSLPKTADVGNYYEMFTRRQLLSLATLKEAVESIENQWARRGMLLAWSATLAKLNKTFLSAEGRAESRGGSSIFSIYRYKIARAPIELPPWETFLERAANIISAKREIAREIMLKEQTNGSQGGFVLHSEDIEDLSKRLSGSIDYIFTDPPYGGHISYLDLSTLWNSWLGTPPTRNLREKELIVGGEMSFSESHYIGRLSKSIEACLRMLKKDRWLSIVFQHWNTAYFEAILSAAAESGAELKAAVSQVGDPIWSMHKKKNKDSVLAGELILTFLKSEKAVVSRNDDPFDVACAVDEMLRNAEEGKIYGEYLFNKLVIQAWKASAIQSLRISKEEFVNLLEERGWRYDPDDHSWRSNVRIERPLFALS